MVTKTKTRTQPAKPATRRRPTKVDALERLKSLIVAAVETRRVRDEAGEAFSAQATEILGQVKSLPDERFVFERDGRTYSVVNCYPERRTILDSILGDKRVPRRLVPQMSEQVVDPDALLAAITAGEIDPEVVERITYRRVIQSQVKALIKVGALPEAVVERHTAINPSAPYPNIDVK